MPGRRNSSVSVHFGLMPTHDGVHAELAGLHGLRDTYQRVYGWTGINAEIGGSWTEWGETDDDGTKGLVVSLHPDDHRSFREQVAQLAALLETDRESRTRVLDYAVITDRRDYSIDLGAVLLDTSRFYVVPAKLMGD